ncbi:hypothetical protein QCA50_011857 [Cerrena zonata]|uniref:F-box domain-containing protein n=1 Tax=Cerrena zonata TaxID=2478898 RepID=A0AAW0G0G3_9APHY
MSFTLPPLKSLLQFGDTRQPPRTCTSDVGYKDFSKILAHETRRTTIPALEMLLPYKKRHCVSNMGNGMRLRTSLPLPHEIHNYILETFWNHKDIECSSPETILACSLTCKVWSNVARRHMFRVIILKSWNQLQRFTSLVIDDKNVIGWVRRVRLCGSLPPFDKTSAGKELPPEWGVRDRWIYYFPYSLAPRIRDKTSITYQPFNIRILELFDFSHISGAVEDCEWFGFWIQHLPWLENVDTLYLKSCEMASNAMVAIGRSLPRLRRVGLTNCDFTSKNHATVTDLSSSPSSILNDEESLKLFSEMCARNGQDVNEVLRDRIPRNGVKYTLMYPAPFIESLYVNNMSSQYMCTDLHSLYGWIMPNYIKHSLRTLDLSAELDLKMTAWFINELGSSPGLQHLRIWFPCDVGLLERFGYCFSKLTNLRSITLHGEKLEGFQVETFLHILSDLNAPGLRQITLAIRHDNRYTAVKELDDCLTHKFKSLEAVTVECVDLEGADLEVARQEIQAIFVQANYRGLLTVQGHTDPFRY